MKQEKVFYGGSMNTQNFLIDVKKLLPKYDELVELISSKVLESAPNTILDIGAGVGNIDEIILSKSKNSIITCIESSKQMADACKKTLNHYNKRTNIINTKIQDFSSNKKFDVAFANLVLHNIPEQEKLNTLTKIKSSLKDGAPFIWSDLITYNPILQEILVGYRHTLALLKGANYKFVMEDLKKERKQDSKLSIKETISLCKKAGFKNPKLIWHSYQSTVGVFYMTK